MLPTVSSRDFFQAELQVQQIQNPVISFRGPEGRRCIFLGVQSGWGSQSAVADSQGFLVIPLNTHLGLLLSVLLSTSITQGNSDLRALSETGSVRKGLGVTKGSHLLEHAQGQEQWLCPGKLGNGSSSQVFRRSWGRCQPQTALFCIVQQVLKANLQVTQQFHIIYCLPAQDFLTCAHRYIYVVIN